MLYLFSFEKNVRFTWKVVIFLGTQLTNSLLFLPGVEGGVDDVGWEEYFDYIFPEDENARPNLKLLAMAKMWKKQKVVEGDKEGFEAEVEVKTEEDMEVVRDDDVEDGENQVKFFFVKEILVVG